MLAEHAVLFFNKKNIMMLKFQMMFYWHQNKRFVLTSTQRCFNIHLTSITFKWCCINVEAKVRVSKHTTLFQHPSNVHNVQMMLYWRQNKRFVLTSTQRCFNIYLTSTMFKWCCIDVKNIRFVLPSTQRCFIIHLTSITFK